MNIKLKLTGAMYEDGCTIEVDPKLRERDYENDAKRLFDTLYNTLPSQTWDIFILVILNHIGKEYVEDIYEHKGDEHE